MAINLGTVKPGSTIYIPFNTFDSNDPSASVAIAAFVVGDIEVYKDGVATTRASTNGYTLLDTDGIDFDSHVGIGGISISLADNSTAGFWAAGSKYFVVIGPTTVDAAVVNFVAATFDIGYDDAILNTTIASLTSATQFILTEGPAEADVLIGCPVLIHDVASKLQFALGVVSDYIVTTKEVFLGATPVGFTPVATDNISIFMPTDLHTVRATVQTAGDIAALVVIADAAIDAVATTIGVAGAGLSDLGGMSTGMMAEIEAEVNDALDTAIAELGVAAPTATPTMRTGLMLMYMALRNKLVVQTSGTDALEIYNNAGTKIAAKLLTDDGSDYTEAEMA